jgi:hypothetical protein
MILVTAHTAALERFQTTLAKYIAGSSRTADEVLEVKGRDLGIKLFRAFRGRQWGGAGLKRNLAKAELARRTALGQGTRVRSRLLDAYHAARAKANSVLRSIGQITRADYFKGSIDQRLRLNNQRHAVRAARANLWRLFVGRETALRQKGIGALAASFLWFRSRKNNQQGRFYVRNKYSNRPPLGYVDKAPGSLRIVGQTPGLSTVDARYGIVSRALASSEIEMRDWMLQRTLKALNLVGGKAA